MPAQSRGWYGSFPLQQPSTFLGLTLIVLAYVLFTGRTTFVFLQSFFGGVRHIFPGTKFHDQHVRQFRASVTG